MYQNIEGNLLWKGEKKVQTQRPDKLPAYQVLTEEPPSPFSFVKPDHKHGGQATACPRVHSPQQSKFCTSAPWLGMHHHECVAQAGKETC